MATVTAAQSAQALKQIKNHEVITKLRERAQSLCKDFKVSWVQLGQMLHAIEDDKLYHAWGFEKLEDYTVKELGFDKNMAIRLLKSYDYLIDEQPAYLEKTYADNRATSKVPSIEEINFLRLARGKKDLMDTDHDMLKKKVFEKGEVTGALKRDLTSLMRERKPVDPAAEREKRKKNLINSLIRSLTEFQADMKSSKLVPYELIKEAEDLLNKLKAQKLT